ncbi:extracellular solute-binding protein, partial [Streptomyces sp. MCAF7]
VDSVRAAGGGDGEEMFSVPTSANQGTLWYRTDLFKAKSLPAPTSWDNFYKAADELTDQDKNKFGFTLRGGAGSIAQAMEMMYAQSGIDTFWDGDKTTLNDPKNVAALEKYVALFKKATPEADLNNDFTKMVAEFDQGDIGMLQHNLGSYNDHVKAFGKDKIAGVPMPPSAEGQPRTIVSNPVDGLGLFKASKNKAAAWKFIEFAASAEMNSLWNEDVGAIPANVDAANDAWIQQAPPTKAALQSLSDPQTKVVQLPYYQFGHNDEKTDDPARGTDPATTYPQYLRRYVGGARDRGARPVLLTSVERRKFDAAGTAQPTHGAYPDAVRSLARAEGVPLIDVQASSIALWQRLGPESTKGCFNWLDPGESPNYPDGKQDNTHFQPHGAIEVARLVARELKAKGVLAPSDVRRLDEAIPDSWITW